MAKKTKKNSKKGKKGKQKQKSELPTADTSNTEEEGKQRVKYLPEELFYPGGENKLELNKGSEEVIRDEFGLIVANQKVVGELGNFKFSDWDKVKVDRSGRPIFNHPWDIKEFIRFLNIRYTDHCLVFRLATGSGAKKGSTKLSDLSYKDDLPFFEAIASEHCFSFLGKVPSCELSEDGDSLNWFFLVKVFSDDKFSSDLIGRLLQSCRITNSTTDSFIRISPIQNFNKFVVLKYLYSGSLSEKIDASIFKFLSKYGKVLTKSSRFIVLDIVQDVLPPTMSRLKFENDYMLAKFDVETNIKYCTYCRCLTHKNVVCPILPTCTHCSEKDHMLLRCPKLTLAQRRLSFKNLPDLFKHDFINRYPMRPKWLRELIENMKGEFKNEAIWETTPKEILYPQKKELKQNEKNPYPTMYFEESHSNISNQERKFALQLSFDKSSSSLDLHHVYHKIISHLESRSIRACSVPTEMYLDDSATYSFDLKVVVFDGLLPPVVNKLEDGLEFKCHVDTNENFKYCSYCRCITHKKKHCPMLSPCIYCGISGHFLVQCPELSNKEKREEWSKLPLLYRNQVIERFSGGSNPMWLRKLIPNPSNGRRSKRRTKRNRTIVKVE